MRFSLCVTLLAGLVLCLAATAEAQAPGQRGPGGVGGFGGGTSRLALLRVEAVQKELELVPDQMTAIQKLQEELRGADGQRGRGQPGQPGQNQRRPGQRPSTDNDKKGAQQQDGGAQFLFVQQPGQGRQNLTEEDRQKLRQQAEERTKKEKEKLGEILLPHQMKRLNEIFIQVLGVAALNDEDVAKALEISADQKDKLTKARTESSETMRTQFRELGQGGDREQMRAKFTELRKVSDEKLLAVLDATQKKKLEELKGTPFKMPEGALRGPGGQGRPQRKVT